MGLLSGLLILPWFVWTELALSPCVNSWIWLNVTNQRDASFVLHAKLKILAVALVLIAVFWSALRLIPTNWVVQKRPLRDRIWPAFAFCIFVLALWFVSSVTPYRLPGMISRGFVGREMKVLHVEKRGMQFREKLIAIELQRDGNIGKFFILQTNRRLFQYRFAESGALGVVPNTASFLRVDLLSMFQKLGTLRIPPAKALRTWNAEGWYILGEHGVLAFTSEYKTEPPIEVVDLFQQVGKLPSMPNPVQALKYVCMGFCYDPLSGLGFVYANERCTTYESGPRCQ
jgi:hypothetical protein